MRRLLGVLSALALVLLTAPAASARSWVHDDGTGDVYIYSDSDSHTPVPDQAEGDITRVQLNHNKRYVQLFMTLRDNERSTLNSFYYFDLENGRHQYRNITVGTARLVGNLDGTLSVEDGHNRAVKCRGTKGFHIDWDKHVVAVTLPRTCFGNPKVLRMRAFQSLDYIRSGNDYIDDATSAGLPRPFGPYATWGPWVKRG